MKIHDLLYICSVYTTQGIMENNKKTILFACWLLLLLSACTSEPRDRKYVIGLSQCMLDDAWRQAMIRDVQIEASNYDNIEIIIKDADSDNNRQIRQIKELIDRKVDVLIISPFESTPITAVAEEAYRQGIPTIITDRKVNTDLYTTFIGADNYQLGFAAGTYAGQYLPPGATVLEVWGMAGSSPAQERHKGFTDALSDHPGLKFRSIEANWRYETALKELEGEDFSQPIDFVYCHNDMMAIAARKHFVALDSVRGNALPIIGIDAVAGAGLESVASGEINASFLYPTGGSQVIRTALRLLRGEKVDKYIPLPSGQVDREAAKSMLLQAEQLDNYMKRIMGQRSRLDGLLNRYHFLQHSLWTITGLMIAFVLLSVYVYYINRKIRLTNRELRAINLKEEQQRRRLIELNAEIEQATASKLQFFTNVSHEVRTPLTLIIGPLERLLNLLHDSPYFADLELIHKNAGRLLRVINQILDFRKVEDKQEKLKVSQVDIVTFVKEIKSYFDSMAKVRQTEYVFTSSVAACMVSLDTDMMEKVLMNLLSNAFKFTPEGGRVGVSVEVSGEHVRLSVEDSGCGIPAENIPYLFNRFYSENSRGGTGIGLHLVNEYVGMHRGTVGVESAPGKGSVFRITLPKEQTGQENDAVTEPNVSALAYDASRLDDAEEKALLAQTYPYTVLVVEDDPEVRAFLLRELAANFHVLEAADGKQALEILQQEDISLVVSDVMMPEMNGFELCRSVKTQLATSHIPVVLLTALSDERQRMYGMAGGADGYIHKPFSSGYVRIYLIRILEERKHLREQLLTKLQESNLLMAEPEKVENMDDLFLRKFLSQIEAVYTDPDFNVEKLSDTLALSRGHLHRKIKELTGTTPVDFLRNYRLKKAAALLKQGQYSVSEIAYRSGFSSPAYFSKCFKTLYGVTPTEYQ